ncbi:hypothetical protein SUDANB145_07302 (plasmid) [Streptomyces sp. enrichment culture]|uniref:hypothetical protein n=1 Tax=Streptomyces sp. enrichment culture TaxID=1795815 RepID=UPI003F567B75
MSDQTTAQGGAVPDFDSSGCEAECPALCEHFEDWYRAGVSSAWKQAGDGLRGVLHILHGTEGER